MIQKSGEFLIRYGLVIVLGWIGAMKFTAYEAAGIKTLVETSPLMSWMYKLLSLQATSNVIGVAEISAALLIARLGRISFERHGAARGGAVHTWRLSDGCKALTACP